MYGVWYMDLAGHGGTRPEAIPSDQKRTRADGNQNKVRHNRALTGVSDLRNTLILVFTIPPPPSRRNPRIDELNPGRWAA